MIYLIYHRNEGEKGRRPGAARSAHRSDSFCLLYHFMLAHDNCSYTYLTLYIPLLNFLSNQFWLWNGSRVLLRSRLRRQTLRICALACSSCCCTTRSERRVPSTFEPLTEPIRQECNVRCFELPINLGVALKQENRMRPIKK